MSAVASHIAKSDAPGTAHMSTRTHPARAEPRHTHTRARSSRRNWPQSAAQLLILILGHGHSHGCRSRAAAAAATLASLTPQPPHPTHTSSRARQSRPHAPDAHTHDAPQSASHTHAHGLHCGHHDGDPPPLTCSPANATHTHHRPQATQSAQHVHTILRDGVARAAHTTRATQQIHNHMHCTPTFDHLVPTGQHAATATDGRFHRRTESRPARERTRPTKTNHETNPRHTPTAPRASSQRMASGSRYRERTGKCVS